MIARKLTELKGLPERMNYAITARHSLQRQSYRNSGSYSSRSNNTGSRSQSKEEPAVRRNKHKLSTHQHKHSLAQTTALLPVLNVKSTGTESKTGSTRIAGSANILGEFLNRQYSRERRDYRDTESRHLRVFEENAAFKQTILTTADEARRAIGPRVEKPSSKTPIGRLPNLAAFWSPD